MSWKSPVTGGITVVPIGLSDSSYCLLWEIPDSVDGGGLMSLPLNWEYASFSPSCCH